MSPTKDASAHPGTPGSTRSHNDSLTFDDDSQTPFFSPPSSGPSAFMDTLQKPNAANSSLDSQEIHTALHELPQLPKKPQDRLGTSPSAGIAPSRSNTLSWQQRPSSRGSTSGSVRSRPSSSLASQKNVLKPSMPDSVAAGESDDTVPRSRITQSLEGKDPSFFKQTQDRGSGLAAYRKSQVELLSDASLTMGGWGLPGMVGESLASTMSPDSSPPGSSRADTSPGGGSVRESIRTRSGDQASVTNPEKGEFHSLMPPSNGQPFESLPSHATSSQGYGEKFSTGRTIAMSPSQGRISTERTERPASPTKGLGGFVQSAMMKRSDSVSKRWSAQAGPGVSRENSLASNRSGMDGAKFSLGGATPLAEPRNSISREATPSATSGPTFSYGNMAGVQPRLKDQTAAADKSSSPRNLEHPLSTSGPMPVDEKSATTPPRPSSPTKGDPIMSPPSSPSKRWSPTKSSWLENAISKPDTPKMLSPSVSQQPAWMANFHRNKHQRGSVNLEKGPAFKEVAVGGLIQSPPPGMGYKPRSIGGFSKGFGLGEPLKPRSDSVGDLRSSETPETMRDIGELSGSSTSPNLSGDVAIAPLSPAPSHRFPQSASSTLTTKTKPATPPKKDFRSTLKAQQISGESKANREPEFRDVFGKLKKTQTQNYIAPDELKDNIMRGKSGLAKTNGPQKSNIKDEFKESILKKREAMVAPSASTRITSAASGHLETSTPEAIAKRKDLGRSQGTISDSNIEDRTLAPKSIALAKPWSLQEQPKPISLEGEVRTSIAYQQSLEKPKPGVGVAFASSLAGILQRGPSPSGGVVKPPPTSQKTECSSELAAAGAAVTQQTRSGPELTHVTKGRARGPKRKPPASINHAIDASLSVAPSEPPLKPSAAKKKPSISDPTTKREVSSDRSAPQPLATITNNKNNSARQVSQPNTPRKPSTSVGKIPSGRRSPAIAQAPIDGSPSKKSSVTIQEPSQSRNSLEAEKSIVSRSTTTGPQLRAPIPSRLVPQEVEDAPIAQAPQKSQSQQPVKSMAGNWGRRPEPTQIIQPRMPIRSPTRQDEEAAVADASSQPKEVVEVNIETPKRTVQISHREAASPSTRSPRSPPLPGKKPAAIDNRLSGAPLSTPAPAHGTTSPPEAPPGAAGFFAEIFDEPPTNKTRINVDTQAILVKPPSSESDKIKTLRRQIFEIMDNGKAISVPPQQEHILFEDSLYVCNHVFGTSAGTRTNETYLWCGNGVSSSAVEDAQFFAKKTAKDNNGKLILLPQGKEPARFFQALGGIVITRKGSSSRSESAVYMLCGRQHLGQIAFDEVDFQPQSLCSGFPYIISARGGRLFLWKGSGAGADELGCARLIGMDLGLTGEIEEVDEGREPPDFWSSFPTRTSRLTSSPSTSQYWHLKTSCDRYATKLFAVDVDNPRPKSSSGFMSWGRRDSVPMNDTGVVREAKIKEVTPFSQADLLDEGIFVLDAFFEIFVYDNFPTLLCRSGC